MTAGLPESFTLGALLIVIGICSVAGGALRWRFFTSNRRFQVVEELLGSGGARCFYILLGLVAAALGVLVIVLS
jgi:hypothetical protein